MTNCLEESTFVLNWKIDNLCSVDGDEKAINIHLEWSKCIVKNKTCAETYTYENTTAEHQWTVEFIAEKVEVETLHNIVSSLICDIVKDELNYCKNGSQKNYRNNNNKRNWECVQIVLNKNMSFSYNEQYFKQRNFFR